MTASSNNPHRGQGKHYWPADHFSVPAEGVCFNIAPSPDADCLCIREKGHAGAHRYEWSPDIRSYSWKDPAALSHGEAGRG